MESELIRSRPRDGSERMRNAFLQHRKTMVGQIRDAITKRNLIEMEDDQITWMRVRAPSTRKVHKMNDAVLAISPGNSHFKKKKNTFTITFALGELICPFIPKFSVRNKRVVSSFVQPSSATCLILLSHWSNNSTLSQLGMENRRCFLSLIKFV